MTAGPWLRRYRPVAAPRQRLVCLPHAGGSAGLYRDWAAALPDDIELLAVCYPGREARIAEPFPAGLTALAADVAAAVRPWADVPLSLFGHSMGAVVAAEVCHWLSAAGVSVGVLLVSAHRPPLGPIGPDVAIDDDEALVAASRSLGAPDADVWDVPALRRMLIAALRADCRLLRDYRPRDLMTGTPIVAYVGEQDAQCDLAAASQWSQLTCGAFDVRVFPGGHFYLVQHLQAVVDDVVHRLPLGPGSAFQGVKKSSLKHRGSEGTD